MTSAEWKRKFVHMGMGVFALALRWLTWEQAALCALAALLFNLFAMPRIGRGIYRDPGKATDTGIVAYPAMVLLLILLFRGDRLWIAAAVWGILAFGDPAASIAGKLLGGPTLPWNREKTWTGFAAFVVFGGAASLFLLEWCTAMKLPLEAWPVLLWDLGPPLLLAAFLESYPAGLNDNWVIPLPAALCLHATASTAAPRWWPAIHLWPAAIGVNALIALVSGSLRLVSPSGAVAGGIVGAAILAFGGWGAYAVLWTFFLLGTVATRIGYSKKTKRGTAQEQQGRRGAAHVIANCGLGVLLAIFAFASSGSRLDVATPFSKIAFAGAFAAALADTFGTEFGSLWGKRAYSLTRFSGAPTGTKGAISIPGTLAGLAGAFVIGSVAAACGMIEARLIPVVAVAGLLGSLAESIILDLSSRLGRTLDHEFVNAFNTLVGGLAALEIAYSLQVGRVYIPFGTPGGHF